MADRIGVINKGELILVEDKAALMAKLGEKKLTLHLKRPLTPLPDELADPRWTSRRGQGARLHLRCPERHRHRCAFAPPRRAQHRLQRPADERELPGGDLRESREVEPLNVHAIRAIYGFEMARTWRTLMQSIAAPVISTSLYFIVFGGAIGSRMVAIDGVSYGAFIVPGLIMLSVLTESVANGSFGIYMPRFSGTIYEPLSAPIAVPEFVIGYVGAAATKSVILGYHHSVHGAAVRPILRGPPAVDDGFSGADLGHFQLLRISHRPVGRWLEKLQIAPMYDRDAADVPGRQLLFDQHVAAGVAEGCLVQPGGLPGERLSLELLRRLRRQRPVERG